MGASLQYANGGRKVPSRAKETDKEEARRGGLLLRENG
jgi:hypothetical protein